MLRSALLFRNFQIWGLRLGVEILRILILQPPRISNPIFRCGKRVQRVWDRISKESQIQYSYAGNTLRKFEIESQRNHKSNIHVRETRSESLRSNLSKLLADAGSHVNESYDVDGFCRIVFWSECKLWKTAAATVWSTEGLPQTYCKNSYLNRPTTGQPFTYSRYDFLNAIFMLSACCNSP